jgi:hypothetical protein
VTATKTRAARNAASPRITAEEIKALAATLVPAITEAITDEADAASLATFCKRHSLSLSMFYKLAGQGLAPTTFKVGARTMISKESAAQWRREREAASAA